MHELSIALQLLDQVTEITRQHGDARVHKIMVRIGALSGVVPDALATAFTLARANTGYANTELELEEVPVAIFCARCMVDATVATPQWLGCPTCGALSAKVVRGRELEIAALELDYDDHDPNR